jgi:hypothetical protein
MISLSSPDAHLDRVQHTHMSDLATIAQESQKLRVLRLATNATDDSSYPHTPFGDCLTESTLYDFLSAGKNLTVLDLDILNTCGIRKRACPYVAALLPKLRRLRIRLAKICTDVLKLLEIHHNTDFPINLTELIVNPNGTLLS